MAWQINVTLSAITLKKQFPIENLGSNLKFQQRTISQQMLCRWWNSLEKLSLSCDYITEKKKSCWLFNFTKKKRLVRFSLVSLITLFVNCVRKATITSVKMHIKFCIEFVFFFLQDGSTFSRYAFQNVMGL